MGLPLVGIGQAHLVLSSGGSVNEAVEALRSDEEVTEAGRARVQWLRRLAHQQGLALKTPPPTISKTDRPGRLDDCAPADEQHRAPHGENWSAGHEPG